MPRDIMPAGIASLIGWSGVFTGGVASGGTSIGVSTTLVGELQSAHVGMLGSVQLAQDPATRTAITIDQMHVSIAAFKKIARKIAKLVRAQPNITSAQLRALGLQPVKPRQPVHAPTTAPVAKVVNRWASNVDLQFGNQESDDTRSKPRGCTGLNVFVATGTLPTDIAGWTNIGFYSRTRVTVPFDPATPAGTKVFICANWQTARGETSPACPPIETVLSGGGQQMTPKTMKIAA